MVDPQPVHKEPTESDRIVDDASDSDSAIRVAVDPESINFQKNGGEMSAGSPSLQQLLRPIAQGVEALARSQFEHADIVARVEKALNKQESLPRILGDMKQVLEQRNSVNRLMFEALHSELKTYKDGFLMESVLRPVIRDLISLYDDITEIHRLLVLALSTQEKRGDLTGGTLMLFENVLSPATLLEHNIHSIIEVLERLDVTQMPSNTGKLDKRSQRAISVEPADDPDQDQQVIKILKRGFNWRERIFRPEEVIIKKWKDAHSTAPGTTSAKP